MNNQNSGMLRMPRITELGHLHVRLQKFSGSLFSSAQILPCVRRFQIIASALLRRSFFLQSNSHEKEAPFTVGNSFVVGDEEETIKSPTDPAGGEEQEQEQEVASADGGCRASLPISCGGAAKTTLQWPSMRVHRRSTSPPPASTSRRRRTLHGLTATAGAAFKAGRKRIEETRLI